MIGFSNLNSLISLCGARSRFGSLSFAQQEGGLPAYTAGDLAKAVGALKITGERLEKIPLEESDGMLKIEIDTSKLKEFSPFFEIVAE